MNSRSAGGGEEGDGVWKGLCEIIGMCWGRFNGLDIPYGLGILYGLDLPQRECILVPCRADLAGTE